MKIGIYIGLQWPRNSCQAIPVYSGPYPVVHWPAVSRWFSLTNIVTDTIDSGSDTMAMTLQPWSEPPKVDPSAFPAWAEHKASATVAFKEAVLAAAQAAAVLKQLRSAGDVVVSMRMDEDAEQVVYEAHGSPSSFNFDPGRFQWSRDVYSMAATRSDLSLWLMAPDERRFGITEMIADHAGGELHAIRDEASKAGSAFGNLPDEILRRVLGWLLRVQPLRCKGLARSLGTPHLNLQPARFLGPLTHPPTAAHPPSAPAHRLTHPIAFPCGRPRSLADPNPEMAVALGNMAVRCSALDCLFFAWALYRVQCCFGQCFNDEVCCWLRF